MKIFASCRLYAKAFLCISSIAFVQCADEQLISNTTITNETELVLDGSSGELDDCASCTYVVPSNTRIVDGAVLGLQPGSVIGLSANATYSSIVFKNIVGTYQNPIIIRNCGGVAHINGTGYSYSIKTEKSQFFRITGGDVRNFYGIIVTGGHMGVNLGYLSTQFEVDHLEIQNSGFAGIMAKTDPSCDEATWRGNFLMKGIALHSNYIHDSGGEGIYAGNSFFMGMNTPCGVKLPHEIHYIRIYNNILKNTGWDGIQLGCATKGASIHANTIENYGVMNQTAQNNGIQIGAGTGGVCYNNLIKGGPGNGVIVMGLGDNLIHNNVIDGAGSHGVFCDERYSPGPGFKFINNTILNPKGDGIRIYADEVPLSSIVNNIIANPGTYYSYSYPRTPNDAFIYKLNSSVNLEVLNNYFTMETAALQFSSTIAGNYRLAITSPVIDRGADISSYNIYRDYYYKPRLKGAGYDIGAVEQY